MALTAGCLLRCTATAWWSSGSMPDCSVWGLRIKFYRGWFSVYHNSLGDTLWCCIPFTIPHGDSYTATLKITDRSFPYASDHLWNQLPGSFRQPRPHLSLPDSSLLHNHISSPSSSPFSPFSPSISHLSFVHGSKHSFFWNLLLHRPLAPSRLI